MPDTVAEKVERVDATPKEAETRAQKKARLTQVLARGLVSDRLVVRNADPKMHYEWSRNTETDIDRFRSMGFQVEHERGKSSGLHGTGDNSVVIGDAILMSIPIKDFEILEELKEERHARRRKMDAKKEYITRSRRQNPDVPVLDPLGAGDIQEE